MNEFVVDDTINNGLLLDRFLHFCQEISAEGTDDYTLSYVADTIAAIYYHREYSSAEEFIKVHEEAIDENRKEWVRYMWSTLDGMNEKQRAEIAIESITHLPSFSKLA